MRNCAELGLFFRFLFDCGLIATNRYLCYEVDSMLVHIGFSFVSFPLQYQLESSHSRSHWPVVTLTQITRQKPTRWLALTYLFSFKFGFVLATVGLSLTAFIQLPHTLTLMVDLWPWFSIPDELWSLPLHVQKSRWKVNLFKKEWKWTDRWTSRPIALPYRLTRSVAMLQCRNASSPPSRHIYPLPSSSCVQSPSLIADPVRLKAHKSRLSTGALRSNSPAVAIAFIVQRIIETVINRGTWPTRL